MPTPPPPCCAWHLPHCVGEDSWPSPQIEARQKTGAPETLKAIAKALGVPLDILVEG